MDRNDDRLNTIKGDTNDALDEAKQRVKAGGEKANRAVQGDEMPLGERIGSHVREIGDNLKGDADRAKRDTRDAATRSEEDGV